MFNFRFCILLAIVTGCFACGRKTGKGSLPGVPLVNFGFNGQIKNDGLLNVFLWGNDNRFFSDGVSGKALDLSVEVQNHRPLLLTFPDQYNPADYDGFSLLAWIKTPKVIKDSCVVLADCHFLADHMFRGWRLVASPNGQWRWEISDGNKTWCYQWEDVEGSSDDDWFQWAFVYSRIHKEALIYRNGEKRAIVGLEQMDSLYFSGVMEVGGSMQVRNFSSTPFNGLLDELSFWGRPFLNGEVGALYEKQSGNDPVLFEHKAEELTVLSFNAEALVHRRDLWDVAIAAIAKADADVVLLQQASYFGVYFSRKYGGNSYQRGNGLMVASRLPLVKTFQSVRDKNAAVVALKTDADSELVMGSCWLSPLPLVSSLVSGNGVDVYAFEEDERRRRGVELKLLLSGLPKRDVDGDSLSCCLGIDLNSGSHLDWTERNKNAHNGMAVSFPLTRQIAGEGFTDSYRKHYPDETLFQGFTSVMSPGPSFNNRNQCIYFKGQRLKLLDSKVLKVVPETVPLAELAVVSVFELD